MVDTIVAHSLVSWATRIPALVRSLFFLRDNHDAGRVGSFHAGWRTQTPRERIIILRRAIWWDIEEARGHAASGSGDSRKRSTSFEVVFHIQSI